MRFEAATVVGSFLTIIGLYLPWASSYGFSFSGFSVHSFLWFAFLLLLAVMVLSIVKIFLPAVSEGWPFQTVLAGMVLFAALMVLIAAIDIPSGLGWSFGQVWSLIAIAVTSVAVLAPFVLAFHFLRVSIAVPASGGQGFSVESGDSRSTDPGQSRRFCSSCGQSMQSGERFCSSCGTVSS
jgi:hypothetical protein